MNIKQILLGAFILCWMVDVGADIEDFAISSAMPSTPEKDLQNEYAQVFNEQTNKGYFARREKKPYTPLTQNQMVAEAVYRFKQQYPNTALEPNTRITTIDRSGGQSVNVQRFQDQTYLERRFNAQRTSKRPAMIAPMKKTGGAVAPGKPAAPAAQPPPHTVAPPQPAPSPRPPVVHTPIARPQVSPPRARPTGNVPQPAPRVQPPSQHPVQPPTRTAHAHEQHVVSTKKPSRNLQ